MHPTFESEWPSWFPTNRPTIRRWSALYSLPYHIHCRSRRVFFATGTEPSDAQTSRDLDAEIVAHARTYVNGLLAMTANR